MVVLVLGLGSGAATAVFTIVDSVVLRPLPYREPDRLVTLWDTNAERGLAHEPISPVNFMDYRALPVFEDAAGWWRPSINLVDPGLDPVRVNTIETSGNLFDVLDVRPQIGPGFPGDVFFSRERIAVISDRLWRTRYSADPAIVGRTLVLNGEAYTVVGVMPPRFHFPDDVDVWQRLEWDFTQHTRAAHFVEAVARLADGVALEQAQAACDTLAMQLQSQYPRTNKAWTSRLVPLLDEQLGYYRPALMVLFGAVGLLLAIGCLNVACLLLTRGLSREREMAVRLAMGASPRRLAAQLLAESLVLSAAGVGVGLAAAAIALPVIIGLSPVAIPRLEEAHLDMRALAAAMAFVAASALFFGLVPALVLLSGSLTERLRSGERGSSRGPRRLYSVLVAGEVALACALLVASALLVRTVDRMMRTPLGIEADDTVITSVQLTDTSYESWKKVADVHAGILERVRQQPGVDAAGGGNRLPLEIGWRLPFAVEGEPAPARPEDAPQAQYLSVSEGYFEALRAPIIAGRAFTPFDGDASAGVVIVNETFARRYMPDGRVVGRVIVTQMTSIGPLGFNLKAPPRPPAGAPPSVSMSRFEVVGIVRDVRNTPLGQVVEPAIYFSTRQFPFREQFIVVRGSDRAAAAAAIRQAVAAVAPDVPLSVVRTWGERFAARTAEPRLLMTILLFFGGLAALLAALGVYGLFSWTVALRTRELAIRLTLGARPAAVGGLVVRHGATLVLIGLVAGLTVVRLSEQVLERVLFEVTASDSGSTAVAGALLAAAALAACVPPALRAMRVDPAEGLRVD